MAWFARLMYRALVWKERQRALRARWRRGPRPNVAGARVGAQPLKQVPGSSAEHLETGKRGETLAYWYLRQAGYQVVARNRRPGAGGELDLVAWDGPVLAFIEVKTRSSLEAGPPEAAVSQNQRRRIVRSAKTYLRRLPRKGVNYRFDIISVLWDWQAGCRVRLIKDAFKER